MKKLVTLTLALLIIAMSATFLNAATVAEAGKKVKDAAEATINYPANLITESVTTVGTAVKNTADMTVGTLKTTGETLTGQPEKAKEIVTTPIEGTVKTVSEAVVDTAKTPVNAAEKTKKQMSSN